MSKPTSSARFTTPCTHRRHPNRRSRLIYSYAILFCSLSGINTATRNLSDMPNPISPFVSSTRNLHPEQPIPLFFENKSSVQTEESSPQLHSYDPHSDLSNLTFTSNTHSSYQMHDFDPSIQHPANQSAQSQSSRSGRTSVGQASPRTSRMPTTSSLGVSRPKQNPTSLQLTSSKSFPPAFRPSFPVPQSLDTRLSSNQSNFCLPSSNSSLSRSTSSVDRQYESASNEQRQLARQDGAVNTRSATHR